MEKRLNDLRKNLMDEGVILYFNGPFSQRVIETLGGRLRTEFDHNDPARGLNVFAIFVELAQNVIRYAYTDDSESAESGVIMVSRHPDGISIWCGNRVAKANVPSIAAQLDEIAQLDEQGLKTLFKQKRQQARDANQRGAGLGLIEIARKVSTPLDYAIEPVDEQVSFFSLTATVKE